MTKVIMIQGTMSGAGKSLLTAGLCRIFREDGLKAAPFKSQNMALNSFITADGLEMGRAQVVQAEAAGTAPSVYMNPILLKPTNDVGTQVIVNGEVLGNMSAREYFSYKKQLIPQIEAAYDKLSQMYDVIVIEGAGSPAEINLKQNDIVNMGLAKLVNAPVLLAGDIDRGGVFAQLLGTMELLEAEEQAMVKGLIINKFRGDKSILEPGIEMLESRVGRKVTGTIPYLNVDIEEEDSLSERFCDPVQKGRLEIAVVKMPRMSNYTDFAPLEQLSEVALRYVERVDQFGEPDLVILPGTKNTMGDLKWLRESGLEAKVIRYAAGGGLVFGICGGYQMLGQELKDPLGVESGGEIRGMGLLPIRTVFDGQKTRTRVEGSTEHIHGVFAGLSQKAYEGYEIHMGVTELSANAGVFIQKADQPLGIYQENVIGTYVHGIFEAGEMRNALMQILADRKGISLSDGGGEDYRMYKERQYQLLAAGMREHLDMKMIYEILEKGQDYDGRI